jgi:hypothetical protein
LPWQGRQTEEDGSGFDFEPESDRRMDSRRAFLVLRMTVRQIPAREIQGDGEGLSRVNTVDRPLYENNLRFGRTGAKFALLVWLVQGVMCI